ncbi:MAG: lysine--tRNA ligase [Porticoccaceae bacterium]
MTDSSDSTDDNKLIAERRARLATLRARGQAFPNGFRRDDLALKLEADFGARTKEELEALGHKVSVAGRVMARRGPFMVLQDMSGRIQLYADKSVQTDIAERWGHWDIGDLVGARGTLHKSGRGDLYVMLEEYELLTKSLRPLPEKYHGLADREQRYRQRYVDLIINEESRQVFQRRSKIIEFVRQYLNNLGFMEVETPMMQVIPGGATARPFVTYHNTLDQEMFLRVAPELYLKRLVVGGFEKVYEINRSFRNEGLSTRHNPEFTMLEFYQAYVDYRDLMDLTEDMLRKLCMAVLGTTRVTYQNADYDFAQPFARMTVVESILRLNPEISAEDLAAVANARALAQRLDIPFQESWGLGKLQVEIFEKTVEARLEQPTFITEYPTEVSPLARRNDDNPFVTDRFEFFVGGRELANGFSELNDSEDQAERFLAQVQEKDAGDAEAMHFDADYIRALEYGLPPTAGEGIGIDRLVMLLTDSASIRDVLLFPHMRPEREG